MRNLPQDDLPQDPPSDWQIVRAWIRRTAPRHKTPLIIAANVLATLAALIVFNALRPLPRPLTQRDIDNAVGRSIENAPPQPSWQSLAFEAIRPSVVIIEADSPGKGSKGTSSLGTGVVIQDTGVILTALHVVQDATDVTVVFADGSSSPALVTVKQPEKDLAVLTTMRVPDELKPATLASAGSLHVGDEVIAVGTPFGIPQSASSGSGVGTRAGIHLQADRRHSQEPHPVRCGGEPRQFGRSPGQPHAARWSASSRPSSTRRTRTCS